MNGKIGWMEWLDEWNDWMNGMIGWMEWLDEWNDWMSDEWWMNYKTMTDLWKNDCMMKECLNEIQCKWMNEFMNLWMTEWMN